MINRLHIPSAPLNEFIDFFYYYKDYNPSHEIERLLPNGEVQVIFELTEHPKYIYDNHSLKEIQSCQQVWFSGFRTEPITIPSGQESEMVVVQFRRGRAYPFLNAPMFRLTNYVVDAELVLRQEILEIRGLMIEAQTPDEKLKILESALERCYLSQLKENAFVDFALERIWHQPAQASIREVIGQTGYSQKHIIKLFKDYVGVTPKEYLKVIRFQKVIQQIESNVSSINWPSLAYESGYYDQSHFISDFKAFSGFTPTQYMNERGDVMNYIPIS